MIRQLSVVQYIVETLTNPSRAQLFTRGVKNGINRNFLGVLYEAYLNLLGNFYCIGQ